MPKITTDGVEKVILEIKNNKTPGENGVVREAVKIGAGKLLT